MATKVAETSGTIAELCWSDNPDYTTGYVRISPLKEKGNIKGGRVFFVQDKLDLNKYIENLEKNPVLISKINQILNSLE